jgi:hypothetical protein
MTFRPAIALIAIVLAVPAFADEPDPHAGHIPPPAAANAPSAAPTPAMPMCPMMQGKTMMAKAPPAAAPAADDHAAPHAGPPATSGRGPMPMMMKMADGRMMPCMPPAPGTVASKPDSSAPDAQQGAPK